jgi:hypothetical protein
LSGILRDALEFGHPSQDNVSIDEHSHALTPFIGTNDQGPDQVTIGALVTRTAPDYRLLLISGTASKRSATSP